MKPAVDAGVDLIYLDESLSPSGKFLVDGVTAIQGVMLLEKEIKQAYPQCAVETEQFNPMNAHDADFSLSHMPLGHPLSGYIFHRFLNVVAEGVNSEPTDNSLMDAEESWGFMLPPAAKEESWLEIAKAFEEYNLVPDSRLPRADFRQYDNHPTGGLVPAETASSSSDVVTKLFSFRGDNGVTAYYAKQRNKRGFVIEKPNDPPQWIATRISGVSSWPGPGILCDWVPEVGLYSDWLIYNGNTMLSLDTAKSYLLRSTATLDQNRFHLTSVPPDFIPYMNQERRIRGQDVGRDGNWFQINFTGHGQCSAYVPDNCRAFLNGRELDVDRASHTAQMTVSADSDNPSTLLAFYRNPTPLTGNWVDLPWETPPDQRSWYVARQVLDDYSPDGPVRMIKDGTGYFNHIGGTAVRGNKGWHSHRASRKQKGKRQCASALEQIADLWDVRCCLEAAAARLACAHVTKSRLQHLRGLCLQRERAAKQNDRRAVDLISIEFHQCFVDMSFNRLIKTIFRKRRLLEQTLGVDYGIDPYAETFEATELGHRQLVEVLAIRDPHLMESLMIRHILVDRERRFAGLEKKQNTKSHPDGSSGKRSHSGSHTTKG